MRVVHCSTTRVLRGIYRAHSESSCLIQSVHFGCLAEYIVDVKIQVDRTLVTMFSDCIFQENETFKEPVVGIIFSQNCKLDDHRSNSYPYPINLNLYVDYVLDKTNKINSSDQITGLRVGSITAAHHAHKTQSWRVLKHHVTSRCL